MAIRRQDLSALCLYYLGYSALRNRILRIRNRPAATFVCFHDLSPETVGCFTSNLQFLKESTNVISLDDFVSGRLSSERINVVITFDDGYKSWISVGIPILKKLGLPATFFISSGFVGLTKEEGDEFMRSRLLLNLASNCTVRGLGVDDVTNLVDEGFTVGGHTVNHCNLAELRDSVQLKYEIAEDKRRLEKITGRKVKYFAYPFGYYQNPDINLASILRESGYKSAVTTISGFNGSGTYPYLLHRELTDASMPGGVFRARVLGNYHAVLWLKQQIRRVFRKRPSIVGAQMQNVLLK